MTFSYTTRIVSSILACGATSLLLGASACTPTVRTFDGGGGGGQGGESAGGQAGQAGQGGDGGLGGGEVGGGGQGGQGGMGGGFLTECVDGLPPYTGPLCGSTSTIPCSIWTDELVSPNEVFRNGAPGIALDGICAPRVAYSEASGGFKGFHAARMGDNNWKVEQTPFPIARGGIAIGKNGESYVLVDDGAFGVTLFRQDPAGWDMGHPIAGKHHATARGLVSDENGFLHGGVRTDTEDAEYGFFDVNAQSWSINPFGAKTSTNVTVALSPAGDAHFAFWSTVNSTWILHWRSPPQALEQALPLNSGGLGLESGMHALTVSPATATNPTGVPHIAAVRVIPGSTNKRELVYTTRDAANSWPVVIIDNPQTFSTDTCTNGPQPTIDGQMCKFDYEEIRPIGIFVEPTGSVRVVYTKTHRMGTRISQCMMVPNFCFWNTNTDESTSAIVVAALEPNQPPQFTALGKDIFFADATAKLDRIGRIHIAGYDQQPSGGYPKVRYVVIGPKL